MSHCAVIFTSCFVQLYECQQPSVWDIILLWMLVLQTTRTVVHEKPENKYNLPVKIRSISSKRFLQTQLPRRSVDVCRVHLLSVLVYSVYLHQKIREFSGFKYHWSWNKSNYSLKSQFFLLNTICLPWYDQSSQSELSVQLVMLIVAQH